MNEELYPQLFASREEVLGQGPKELGAGGARFRKIDLRLAKLGRVTGKLSTNQVQGTPVY